MSQKSIQILKGELKKKGILSDNTSLRYLTFSALYISEGIPIGIMFYAIPAWLAMNEITPIKIASYVAIIIIPWSFKIILAPLMDRYTLLSMGRKRPWIILGQVGLIISFLSIGFVKDPINNINGLMIVGFIISFFGAIQDIAIDGMAVDIIPLNQQARTNGIMWGSRIIGQSLSLLIGTTLINVVGFTNAISSLALLVAILILVPILIRERPGEKFMPWSVGKPSKDTLKLQSNQWQDLLKSLLKVVILPSSLFLCLGVLFTGTLKGLIDTLLPIFTVQQLEWTNTSYSQVYSAATLIGGCFGIFVGGPIIDFLGTKKMISILLISTSILIACFSQFSGIWENTMFVYGFVILYYLMGTLLTIAILATGMKLTWKKISASQFTLYMTINNLGFAFGSWFLGRLSENISWEYILLTVAVVPLIAFIVYRFINLQKHLETIQSFDKVKNM